jgi:hypothetical protein
MRANKLIFLTACMFLFICVPNVSAVTIVANFIGGAAPFNASGGGNLTNIMNTAAHLWESAYSDPLTITLYYGWARVGDAGTHTLMVQGDFPNRELVGQILFDNSGNAPFYLDPTPDSNEEYRRYTEEQQNLGGGFLNVARVYSDPTGAAQGQVDLLSVALHEIGHAMGMCAANTSFVAKSRSGFIAISGSVPFAQTTIPLTSNYYGIIAHFDSTVISYGSLMSGVNADERRMPSELDIVANAQISGLTILNLKTKLLSQLEPVPVKSAGRMGIYPLSRFPQSKLVRPLGR